jgi:hypothetical protein
MTKKFVYKSYHQGKDKLLAIADAAIVGKEFSKNELHIDVSEAFYHEKECDEKEALRLIKDATIVNAVGNSIISLIVKNKIAEKENILYIGEVAHAQIFTI